MPITLKRIYEPPDPADGTRVLVERLWPRGLSKAKAAVDVWARDLAPSTALRQWFDHEPSRWDEFKSRYFTELDERPTEIAELLERVQGEHVTFVFASREERYNNAVALAAYLSTRG